MKNDEVLNVKDLSTYLSCSTFSIRKLIHTKNIPYFRIGNKYFFRIETIKDWIYNQEKMVNSKNYVLQNTIVSINGGHTTNE